MTSFLIIIVIVAILIAVWFFYRKSVANYVDDEVEKNRALNESDDEKEYLRQLYSSLTSDELIVMKNSGHLPLKETDAIDRVLRERQTLPPFS